MDRKLKTSVELVEQPADFYEIILFKAVDMVSNVVPHLRVKMAAAVRQRKRQVKLATLFRLSLF